MKAGGISTPLGTYGSPIARASSCSPPLFRSHHFHPLHFKLSRFVCLSHFCAFQTCYPPSFSDHLPPQKRLSVRISQSLLFQLPASYPPLSKEERKGNANQPRNAKPGCVVHVRPKCVAFSWCLRHVV